MTALIAIDPRMVETARGWQEKIYATNLERTPNYTGLSRNDRFLNGYLGEIAVDNLFRAWQVPYIWHVSLIGRSAGPDFHIEAPGGRQSADVKTSAKATARDFLMPAAQDVDCDIYIGCRIQSREPECWVEVMGWLHGEAVRNLPISGAPFPIPTRHCAFGAMFPLPELRALLSA